MLQKINRKLLEMTYPNVDLNLLEEVISATPNEKTATEILCGLYEEPNIPRVVKQGDEVRTFESYDKWNERVNYTFERKDTKSAYFPKGTKKTDVTLETFDKLKESYKSNTDQEHFSIETGTVSTVKNYSSLEDWMRFTVIEGAPVVETGCTVAE